MVLLVLWDYVLGRSGKSQNWTISFLCQQYCGLAHNMSSHPCWDPQAPRMSCLGAAPCSLPSMVPMCSDSLQCHPLENLCRIVYFSLGWVYLNVCPYAGNPSSMRTQSSWSSWLLFLAMTISQRLGAALFMFNLLSVYLWISLWQTEMSQMGNMCGRGLCFWTSTILLCFSPSSTTHFEKSQGNYSPDHWQKQQNLPLRTRMRDVPGAQQLFRELTQFGRMKDSHQAGRKKLQQQDIRNVFLRKSLWQTLCLSAKFCMEEPKSWSAISGACCQTREGAKTKLSTVMWALQTSLQWQYLHGTPAVLLIVSPSGSANSVW